jgi:hypothetical protein
VHVVIISDRPAGHVELNGAQISGLGPSDVEIGHLAEQERPIGPDEPTQK